MSQVEREHTIFAAHDATASEAIMARVDGTRFAGPGQNPRRDASSGGIDRGEPSPERIEEIRAKIAAESKARRDAAYDQFTGLFAEWLRCRAQSLVGFGEEDIPASHGDREDELARLITVTPAAIPWMIFYKLQVLEHYLGDEGTNWTDNREVVMLAGIRADLLRFTMEDRS